MNTAPLSDADLVAVLSAIDPIGTGGVVVRGWPGVERERWMARFRGLIAVHSPVRRVPLHTSDERLVGGLDLAATLQTGRPVLDRGLLAESDGGFILLAQAERATASMVAQIVAALDLGAVIVERDGITDQMRARFGVIAFDEGLEDDERLAPSLSDRLAFSVELSPTMVGREITVDEIAAARAILPEVEAPDAILDAICQTAMALGVESARGTVLALAAARALAALDGRLMISRDDAAMAARLVLSPRATLMPMSEPPDEAPPPEPEAAETPPPDAIPERAEQDTEAETEQVERELPLAEMILAAAIAAMPPGVLERLRADLMKPGASQRGGKAGALRVSQRRGRPAGVRRGVPGRGARLNIIETLRAAAPWQMVRRAGTTETRGKVSIRRDDFRIQKMIQRTETTTIFLVDASGSLAINRLAEAKGAVELLLAECYIRRDRVALIAFRGRQAELLLPPTRSLVRAKRSLASLPGGGGTPLAAALDAAAELAGTVRRSGQTPVIVLMTDGRANVARDGVAGRARAEADALLAARSLRAARLTAILVDTSAKVQPLATEIAAEMGATYLQLPYADASVVAQSVRSAAQSVPCRS